MNVSIPALQQYLYQRYGSWAEEQGLFLKLVEELGEVAEVINKRAGRKAPGQDDLTEQLGMELADMIHYIVAIAAVNNIDLNQIILEKDKRSSEKYNHDTNLTRFLESSNQ